MPKCIFTWRPTQRKHSVSGKQSRMCLLQKTSLHASVTFLHWNLKEIIFKNFSCPYLSNFPNWKTLFAISVCIAVHSRLSWIFSEEFSLFSQRSTDFLYPGTLSTQVERHYSSYWSNSDEAGSPSPTWINPFINYQRLQGGGQETFLDFIHRLLSG